MTSWLWPSVRISMAGVTLCAVIPLAAQQPEQSGALHVSPVVHPDELRSSPVTQCDSPVRLVVIASGQWVWVGQSGIWDEHWLPWDELETTLRAIKRSPFFRDRADIIVSADGTHQTLIDLLATAHRAGFVDAGYASPDLAFARYGGQQAWSSYLVSEL